MEGQTMTFKSFVIHLRHRVRAKGSEAQPLEEAGTNPRPIGNWGNWCVKRPFYSLNKRGDPTSVRITVDNGRCAVGSCDCGTKLRLREALCVGGHDSGHLQRPDNVVLGAQGQRAVEEIMLGCKDVGCARALRVRRKQVGSSTLPCPTLLGDRAQHERTIEVHAPISSRALSTRGPRMSDSAH